VKTIDEMIEDQHEKELAEFAKAVLVAYSQGPAKFAEFVRVNIASKLYVETSAIRRSERWKGIK